MAQFPPQRELFLYNQTQFSKKRRLIDYQAMASKPINAEFMINYLPYVLKSHQHF